ncbi:cAMP-binding domain of CRP or a regulatory subunit of cAMP-dependent protein kinases [Arenibacter nanhaiticus]|uniref:cAMP-binding domain of CRP or a regulatory subunit of cAMP-dependent protein kinases n=1 Tax=Arenibacter nanhaiticus TaxID=558155 RepID=A0A1M6E3Z7_9FLAO|nr:response regulator [Arenibacter nanhaiticus]SHI80264.1 cAMP-binding domain of CRP or a regulatory subunit of cAMP-dependent protein kinases [Arenibacter nanhaiticus]
MSKILIIEDDPLLRENTAELLGLSGYEVLTAENGQKGVKTAKELLPDLIICDIMMPVLDGYGVLKALSKEETTRLIPFVFMSAKTENKDVRKGMALGADDYLTKPFEEADLLGAIESRLAKIAILKERNALSLTVGDVFQIATIDDLKCHIKNKGKSYDFKIGEYVYKEGDHVNMVFIIIRGVVKTHRLDEQGKELITGVYKEGDFFGFGSFGNTPFYAESAAPLEHTTLVGLRNEEFRNILQQNSLLSYELMKLLAVNLSETKTQLLEMAYGSVRKKTARTILKFAEKLETDAEGCIHILRTDLASVAGMATETLIRTLSSFKKEGLIEIKDRNIKVIDIEKLKKIQ